MVAMMLAVVPGLAGLFSAISSKINAASVEKKARTSPSGGRTGSQLLSTSCSNRHMTGRMFPLPHTTIVN
ncbi:hypothetical protein GWI33_016421 [Rhynchophorus ferrugineus]|uniref:Secreted protein n=1 Tax=Rhynchophorus ferrugineus TaxID=354439 RepID=A0A834I3K9_RHYFE|nr:hypothetical protein GWI33_016421 [Rhynchophorus ferrugineus]